MSKQLFGIREANVYHAVDEITTIHLELVATPGYNAQHILDYCEWDDLFPGNSIVKCGHCGQWGARKTECKHCGVAID